MSPFGLLLRVCRFMCNRCNFDLRQGGRVGIKSVNDGVGDQLEGA